jgi:hypothetical protein
MTPEQKRIAIARALGWINVVGDMGFPPNVSCWDARRLKIMPDYINDLNACSDFESTLTDEQWHIYALHLGPLDSSRVKHYIGATAEQRCNAFIEILGLNSE